MERNNFIKKINLIIDPSYNIELLFKNDFDELLNFMNEGLNHIRLLRLEDTPQTNIKEDKISTSNAISFTQRLPDDFKVVFFILLNQIISRTNNQSLRLMIEEYFKIEHPDRELFILKMRNIKNKVHTDMNGNYSLEIKKRLEEARIMLA